MAIQVNGAAAFTVTMTDAEFLRINGVAAPSIPATSPFFAIPFLTAVSGAGTTTLSLAGGRKELRRIEHLCTIIRRAVATFTITYTP